MAHEQIAAIAQVHGPVVDIRCERLPPLHQALSTPLAGDSCLFEVHRRLDEWHVRAMTLHKTAGLRRGMPVFDTGAPVHVPAIVEAPTGADEVQQAITRLIAALEGLPVVGGRPLPLVMSVLYHESAGYGSEVQVQVREPFRAFADRGPVSPTHPACIWSRSPSSAS